MSAEAPAPAAEITPNAAPVIPLAQYRAMVATGGISTSNPSGLATPSVATYHGEAAVTTLAASPGPIQRQAQTAMAQAQQRIDALNKQIESLSAIVNGGMGALQGQDYTGASAQAASQARAQLQQLQATKAELQKIMADVDKQMHPGGFESFFRGDNAYNDVLAMLTKPELSVARGSAIANLVTPGATSRSSSVSFDQIMGTLERTMASATQQATSLRDARAAVNAKLDQQAAQLQQLAAQAAQLKGDEPFALTGFDKATAGIKARIDAIRSSAQRDPLSASLDTSAIDAMAMAQKLIKASADAQGPMSASLAPAVTALQHADIRPDWVAAAMMDLTKQANDTAAHAGQSDFASQEQAYEQALAAFSARVKKAGELATAMTGASTKAVNDADASITQTRAALAQKTGQAAPSLLTEQGLDPTVVTRQARTELRAMADALAKGDIDAAAAAQSRSAAAVKTANDLLAQATASAGSHGATVTNQRNQIAQLRATASQREPVVARIEQSYADDVAKPERQRLNGANAGLTSAEAGIGRAADRFAKGGLIGAARDLQGTQGTIDQAGQALTAIATSDANLLQADRDNASQLQALRNQLGSLIASSGTVRTRPTTRAMLSTISARLDAEARMIGERGRNPTAVASELGNLQGEVNGAQTQMSNDAAAYAAAISEIQSAQQVLLINAAFRRDSTFAAQFFLWQTLLNSGLDSRIANGDYEGAAAQARNTALAVTVMVRQIEAREEAEREAAEEAARARAAAEEQARRDAEAEAERRRQQSQPHSGDGFGNNRPSSGDGFSNNRSSSGDGFSNNRSQSGDGFGGTSRSTTSSPTRSSTPSRSTTTRKSGGDGF